MASPERQNPSRIKNIKNRTKHQLVDVTVEEEDKPNTGERTAHSNRKKKTHKWSNKRAHTSSPTKSKIYSMERKRGSETLPSKPANYQSD